MVNNDDPQTKDNDHELAVTALQMKVIILALVYHNTVLTPVSYYNYPEITVL